MPIPNWRPLLLQGQANPQTSPAKTQGHRQREPPLQLRPPAGSLANLTLAPLMAQSMFTNAASTELVDITLRPDTTLPEAVAMLARTAMINYQLDPQLLTENKSSDEKTGPSGPPLIGSEIHWENVTALQALQALLDNYNWQLTPDSKTGIARITQKDPRAAEATITKVIKLHNAAPTNLLANLSNLTSRIPNCIILPDSRTSQVVLVAPERQVLIIESLIKQLDTELKQILIEARLIETTRNPKSVKGIDWSGTLSAQNLSFGNGFTSGTKATTTTTGDTTTTRGDGTTIPGATTTSTTGTSTMTTTVGNTTTPSSSTGSGGGLTMDTLKGLNPTTAFLNADGLQAVMSLLNSDTESEAFNLPRTVAMDGTPTELAVIQNIPVFEQNQTAGSSGSQSLATVKPVYVELVGDTIINEVGVKLQVTPRIIGETNVQLDLHPEVSDQDSVLAEFTLNGTVNTSPIFNRRKIQTRATVPSGFTLVLGGLKHDFQSIARTKVPLLGDIPGMGWLFRHEEKSGNKRNLMIFVTPTIISEPDFQPTKSEFLKNRFIDKPDAPDGMWDSAKPADWTKPKPQQVEPVYKPAF